MKNYITLFVFTISFLSTSSDVFASCYQKLTKEHTRESFVASVEGEKIEHGQTTKEKSLLAVQDVFARLDCQQDKEDYQISSLSCKELVKGKWFSTVCYMESRWGYFFVSFDMFDNAHVAYARWD